MIEFEVSAPNKLNLFGVHTANYDKANITTSINLRTTLSFEELPESPENLIIMECPYIKLRYAVPLELFLEHYRNYTLDKANNVPGGEMQQFILNTYSDDHATIILAYISLFFRIADKEQINIKSCRMKLSTKLPMDPYECLGSFSVCFAACFLHWAHRQRDPNVNAFNNRDIEMINTYVSSCKENIPRFPIADAIVCTYDFRTVAHKTGSDLNIEYESIETLGTKILLVDSNVDDKVKAQLQVTEFMRRKLTLGTSIVNNINNITKTAFDIFKTLGVIHSDRGISHIVANMYESVQHDIIMDLMKMNHQLLKCLYVPHFKQNRIYHIAQDHKASAKYTNGLKRRYAYIWCPPNMKPFNIRLLKDELRLNNFNIWETDISCDGVRIE